MESVDNNPLYIERVIPSDSKQANPFTKKSKKRKPGRPALSRRLSLRKAINIFEAFKSHDYVTFRRIMRNRHIRKRLWYPVIIRDEKIVIDFLTKPLQ